VHPVFISKSIRSDLSKLIHIQKAGKILEELLREGEYDEALFNFLNSWILHVDAAPSIGEAVWYSFLIKLFNFLGFKPVLDHCVLNDSHQVVGQVFFVASLGGVICKECEVLQVVSKTMFIQLNEEDVVVLKKMLEPNWLREDVHLSHSVKHIIVQFGEYHLGKKIGV
jgi:recombinational DNA repair protein (RecF pathway)